MFPDMQSEIMVVSSQKHYPVRVLVKNCDVLKTIMKKNLDFEPFLFF